MTKGEAEFVIKIMLTAEGGWPASARSLLWQFIEGYPKWENLAAELYQAAYPFFDNLRVNSTKGL